VSEGGDIFPSGVPLLGAEARIVDGCVEVRAPTLFSGYLGDATRHTPEIWLATRDRGFIAENGELVITGRASDLIITGGENVDPVEVEAALATVPGVKQCFVYGVPDGVFGQIVAALVVAGPETPTTAEALAERLSGRLASFKLPRRLALVEALPLTPSGKIDRRAAQALRPFAG
jgi:acyl-CoA synthetase (AMP-forming)/AMP-acid ligase II